MTATSNPPLLVVDNDSSQPLRKPPLLLLTPRLLATYPKMPDPYISKSMASLHQSATTNQDGSLTNPQQPSPPYPQPFQTRMFPPSSLSLPPSTKHSSAAPSPLSFNPNPTMADFEAQLQKIQASLTAIEAKLNEPSALRRAWDWWGRNGGFVAFPISVGALVVVLRL